MTFTTIDAAVITTQEMKRDHVAIFPFMAKGHTIPLLHLAAYLADGGLRVTLITTAGNAAFLRRSLPSNHPNIHILTLPFPTFPPLPEGCESTDQLPSAELYPAFLGATALLRRPFHRLLLSLCRSSAPPPLCLISDFYFGWTLPVCRSLGVPRVVFHGMGAFSVALCKSLWLHQPDAHAVAGGEPFSVPGALSHLRLTLADVPETVRKAADPDDPVTQFTAETGESDVSSWGVLVNSFAELEQDYVAPLESFYHAGGRAWLVGPLSLLSGTPETAGEESECLQWLDGREPGSVVYVSFGTQTHVPDEQLDEVAHGLAASDCDFIWVVRSSSWTPPEGVEKRWEGSGRIEKGWAPQREVLGHAAVGGFVSHCGWNSVLESVAAGVPILTWPMMAEQSLNAKLVVEELAMGLRLKVDEGKLVDRREVCEGVRELMKGRRARERAAELRAAALAAVGEGGSSRRTLDELIEELRKFQKSSNMVYDEGLLELEKEMVNVDPTMQLEWKEEGIKIA